MIKVISVGGSIISPRVPDRDFLTSFLRMCIAWLHTDASRRLVLVTGGGGICREYQEAYREIVSRSGLLASALTGNLGATKEQRDFSADLIGVRATHFNAELVRGCLGSLAPDPVAPDELPIAPDLPVITDPTANFDWRSRALVAGGWKPGFSSDYDAVLLAEKYGATEVINLSNITQVYDKDPNKYPDAVPLESVTWADFRQIVGSEWTPGLNMPFDPIASQKAAELGLAVICADGHNIDNTRAILNSEPFIGTTIS